MERFEMKREELIKRLLDICTYRCEGCLSNTGGCSCLKDKERMLVELIKELEREKNGRKIKKRIEKVVV
jgi:hypothetical protein